LKKIASLGVIFAAAILVAVNLLRYTSRFRIVALSPAELTLKLPKAKPPTVEECFDVQHTLAELSKPKRVLDKRPPKDRGVLSSDEIAIYRAVLRQWVAGGGSPLNVSLQTYPLDVLSDAGHIDCHSLTREVLPRRNMKLVNENQQAASIPENNPGNTIGTNSIDKAVSEAFDNGIFSVSEIVFDKEHRRALVSYGFHCGLLCGSGRTLVFERIGDEWRRTSPECGGWIS
jgi:hypothetical protein